MPACAGTSCSWSLDAAYAEYADAATDYESGMPSWCAPRANNVIMTADLLQDLRHGGAARWAGAYGPPEPVIDALNRIRGPFQRVGQAAHCCRRWPRFGDTGPYRPRRWSTTRRWLPWLTELDYGALGLEVTPSVGNFLLDRTFPADSETRDAAAADAILQGRRHRGTRHGRRLRVAPLRCA